MPGTFAIAAPAEVGIDDPAPECKGVNRGMRKPGARRQPDGRRSGAGLSWLVARNGLTGRRDAHDFQQSAIDKACAWKVIGMYAY
jgi:hypothetical protein